MTSIALNFRVQERELVSLPFYLETNERRESSAPPGRPAIRPGSKDVNIFQPNKRMQGEGRE